MGHEKNVMLLFKVKPFIFFYFQKATTQVGTTVFFFFFLLQTGCKIKCDTNKKKNARGWEI